MPKPPVHEVLEERLARRGFRCFTREIELFGQICYEVFIAHTDGRKGKMVSKRRTDALMGLIHVMGMSELTSF
jgi:hypothetical protein